jgi:hypothetical protein
VVDSAPQLGCGGWLPVSPLRAHRRAGSRGTQTPGALRFEPLIEGDDGLVDDSHGEFRRVEHADALGLDA